MQKSTKIPDGVFDIGIIGGGPGGLTSALYASRGSMKTVLIESLAIMGQATMTDLIENYPGVKDANGFDLMMVFRDQAKTFGTEFKTGTVKRLYSRKEGDLTIWCVEDENGITEALTMIIASGAVCKKLGVPGETEFLGKGVSYCATCDGAFFRDKDIIVVGGGDTAVEEGIFLTKFGKKVTIIHRRDRLRATKIVRERAFANEKMDFIWDSTVEEICGDEKLEYIKVVNLKTGEKSTVKCSGIFIFVGWYPCTDYVKDLVEHNDYGAIKVDSHMRTSVEGLYAAGDCVEKLLNQVITACGDGATAAYAAQQYIEELKGTAY